MKSIYVLLAGDDCIAFKSIPQMMVFLKFQWQHSHALSWNDILNLVKTGSILTWNDIQICYTMTELK